MVIFFPIFHTQWNQIKLKHGSMGLIHSFVGVCSIPMLSVRIIVLCFIHCKMTDVMYDLNSNSSFPKHLGLRWYLTDDNHCFICCYQTLGHRPESVSISIINMLFYHLGTYVIYIHGPALSVWAIWYIRIVVVMPSTWIISNTTYTDRIYRIMTDLFLHCNPETKSFNSIIHWIMTIFTVFTNPM